MAIEKDKLHIEKLKYNFETKESFKTSDLALFYKTYESELPQTTLNWRIYHLVQQGVLERLGRGTFRIGKNRLFVPEITSQQKSIYNKLSSLFPFSNFCIWNTFVINEFSRHQSNINFTLVEVEKESLQAIFYELQEFKNNVFLEPKNDVIENYLSNAKGSIIVKTLITEAPLQKTDRVNTITIEKLLVDLYCDKELFFTFQGKELRTIMEESFSKYSINQSKMIRYANRRGRQAEVVSYLKQIQIIGNNIQ